MKMRLFITLLSFLSTTVFSQNTVEFLHEDYMPSFAYEEYQHRDIDRIIEIGSYDTIAYYNFTLYSSNRNNYIQITEYGVEKQVPFEIVDENHVAIKEGKWLIKKRGTDEIIEELEYHKGFLLKVSVYDEDKGFLRFEKIYNYEEERVNRLYYSEEGRLIKNSSVSIEGGEVEAHYYPNDNLHLPAISFNRHIDYTEKETDTISINIFAKRDDDSVKFDFNPKVFQLFINSSELFSGQSYSLKKGEAIEMQVIITPNRENYLTADKVQIKSDKENKLYEIDFSLSASHADYDTLLLSEHSIKVKRSNYPYFVIAPIGTITTVGVTSEDGAESWKNTGEFGSCVINLLDIGLGEFDVSIGSCHNSGRFKLIIEE